MLSPVDRDRSASTTARRTFTRRLSAAVLLGLLAACDAAVRPEPDGPVTDVWTRFSDRIDVGGLIQPQPPEPPVAPGSDVPIINFSRTGARMVRLDTDGNSIDAHDGEIERFGDLFYMYGASYGCGFHWKVPGTPYCGVRIYSSPNLVDWSYVGLAFNPSTVQWQKRCDGGTMSCFRPHVAYNAATQRYVLWLNTYDVPGGYRVFTAELPTGPFQEQTPPRLANSRSAFDPWSNKFNGDHNLFVDDDGKGYVVYTDWRRGGDIVVEELTRDYLSGTGRHTRLGLTYSEAPTIFKRGAIYYLLFSDPACPYCRTGSSYVTARSPLGPWTQRTPVTRNSCGGQPTHVSPLPGRETGTVFLYQSDLWDDAFPNQAPAPQFWAPLRFTTEGAIEPIECRAHYTAPIATTRPVSSASLMRSHARLIDDVGAWGGEVSREARFTAPKSGTLRQIVLPVFKKTWLGGSGSGAPKLPPLRVEIHSEGEMIERAEVAPERVAHGLRLVSINTSAAVTRGRSYVVRLVAESAAREADRYGFSFYQGGDRLDDFRAFVSRSGGPWVAESDLTLRIYLRIDG